MPVLFSGASNAEGLQQLGNAGVRLATTIWEKLDEAEAASEFLTGKQLLAANINKFDQSLANDPDIDQWGDKNNKAMDEAWTETEKVIKNTRAINALNEYWANENIARGEQINNRIIDAKNAKLLGAFQGRLESIMGDTSKPTAQKKAEIVEEGDVASATMVVDPKAWEIKRASLFKDLDKSDLMSAGLQMMREYGKEAGLDWMIDPSKSAGFTTLDAGERKSLASSAGESYQLIITVQGKKADATNKENVGKALDWILTDTVPEDAYMQISKMQFQSVPEAGVDGTAEKTRAYELIKSYLAEKTAKGRARTQDEEDADLADWYEKLYTGELGFTDKDLQETADKVLNGKVGTFGAKKRFVNVQRAFMDDGIRAIVDTYKPLPGANEEEVAVARRAIVYGTEYLQKHPEIKDPAARLKIFDDIYKNKASTYIDGAVTTLSGLQSVGETFKKWAGKDVKKLEMADLFQKGTLQASLDVDSGVKRDYDSMMGTLLPTWYAANGFITDKQQADNRPTLYDPNAAKRENGKFKGQVPLAIAVPKDKKKVFQLWKDGSNFNWYWAPYDKYGSATDADWTKLK